MFDIKTRSHCHEKTVLTTLPLRTLSGKTLRAGDSLLTPPTGRATDAERSDEHRQAKTACRTARCCSTYEALSERLMHRERISALPPPWRDQQRQHFTPESASRYAKCGGFQSGLGIAQQSQVVPPLHPGMPGQLRCNTPSIANTNHQLKPPDVSGQCWPVTEYTAVRRRRARSLRMNAALAESPASSKAAGYLALLTLRCDAASVTSARQQVKS
jgi:hypothetical protein